MNLRKPTLLAATFLTSIALTACQAENKTNSTSKPTAQHSVQKTDTDSHKKTDDAKKVSNSSEITQQENTSGTQEKTTSPQVSTTSTIDLEALSQGNYSSIVGTWSNAEGNSFVIDAQGNITHLYEGSSHEGYSIQVNQVSNTMVFGGLIAPNGQAEASFMVIPAGVSTPNSGKSYQQDVICSGQSALAEDNPYFKVNETKP